MASFVEIAEIVEHGSEQQRHMFSRACSSYVRLSSACSAIMRELSRDCGWKGPGSLDMKDFHRFHIEKEADGIHFYNGRQSLCCFSIDAEGRACVEGDWFPYGAGTDEAIAEARANCLSEDNRKNAFIHTLGGCRMIQAMESPYEGRIFVCREPWMDSRVEDMLKAGKSRMTFLDRSEYQDTAHRYYDVVKGFHEDRLRPQKTVYLYDGKKVSFGDVHPSGDEMIDRILAARDRNKRLLTDAYGSSLFIRSVLEEETGLEKGHDRMYAFETAVYPVISGVRSIDFVKDGGAEKVGSIQFVGGSIIYVGKDVDRQAELSDISEVEKLMNDVCLSKSNIACARADLMAAKVISEDEDLSESQSEQQSESKGKKK